MLGLIGKKIGMTHLFDEDGKLIPVTAIEAGPCPVIQVKTEERDGYIAVQLGFGRKKAQRSRKPELGHAASAGLDYVPAITREFRLGKDDALADDPHTPAAPASEASSVPSTEATSEEDAGETNQGEEADAANQGAEQNRGNQGVERGSALRVGQLLTVSMFSEGERVRITGRTKGRGFQGVVKRHGFGGFPKTHGHPSGRLSGSIGPGTDPSRVIKGRRMPGHMGAERKTVRNLSIVKIDPDRNLIFVRGGVPGARNGWVFVRKQ